MRRFLSFVALLVALVAATASLAAYLAHETVLDPKNAGAVAAESLQDDELRRELLTRALPEYDRLPGSYRERVERAAERPQVRRALEQVQVDDQGRVSLGPVRRQVLQSLGQEYPELAAQLEGAGGKARFRLPSDLIEPYRDARRVSWAVATRGAFVALASLLAGGLLARGRRAGLLGVGLVLLLSSTAAVGAILALPEAAGRVVGLTGVEPRLLRAAVPDASTLFSLVLPVVVAGFLATVLSLLLPRRR